MAFEGFKKAITVAGITAKDIDASVFCSAPEYDKQRLPSAVIAEYLGLNPADLLGDFCQRISPLACLFSCLLRWCQGRIRKVYNLDIALKTKKNPAQDGTFFSLGFYFVSKKWPKNGAFFKSHLIKSGDYQFYYPGKR